jgi:phage major head subunit gpT-like protein
LRSPRRCHPDPLMHALHAPVRRPLAALRLRWPGVNSTNLRTIYTAFNSAFKGAFALAKPMWQQIAMMVPSTTGTEEYGWLGMTTKYREWLGERVYQNLKLHGYTIKNKTFESTVEVPRDSDRRRQYGLFTPLMAQMGQDAALHPDELIFTLAARGLHDHVLRRPVLLRRRSPGGPAGPGSQREQLRRRRRQPVVPAGHQQDHQADDFPEAPRLQLRGEDQLDDDNVFERNEFVFGSDARVNVGFGLWQLAYASKQALDVDGLLGRLCRDVGLQGRQRQAAERQADICLVGPSNWKAALDIVQAERLANGASNTMQNTTRVVLCPWLA